MNMKVILRRESMSCPTFSNLKTLALGEWCISSGAEFFILILLLQHSPNLEKLFLELEMVCPCCQYFSMLILYGVCVSLPWFYWSVNKVVFLSFKKNYDIQKTLGRGIKPKGGSFACKHLSMVKIRCTKDDPRLHMLAQLFGSNGVPLKKIYVRQSGSFCEYLMSMSLCLSRIVASLVSHNILVK